MTCIAGIAKGGKVWLGGDRAATSGKSLNRTLLREPKVFLKEGIGFGFCGLPKAMDALRHAASWPAMSSNDPKGHLVTQVVPNIRNAFKDLDCTSEFDGQQHFPGGFLIGLCGRLFELQSNFQLIEASRGFLAIGSGGPAALGSLRSSKGDPCKRILEALKVSAEENAGVAAPFDVIVVAS